MADSGDNNNGAPNVEAALATSASAAAQIQATRKPTIGQRKPQAKKGGVSFQNMNACMLNTVPIDRILSEKNARAWVSIDFT